MKRVTGVADVNELAFRCYRKKPVVVKAQRMDEAFTVQTLNGPVQCEAGEYLIQGVNGEFYPCKPDIFEKTYEDA